MPSYDAKMRIKRYKRAIDFTIGSYNLLAQNLLEVHRIISDVYFTD